MVRQYTDLINLLQSGKEIQTGSLLCTKGSAPQVPGAMAVFDKEKVLSGTLGGGLLEAKAQIAAAESAKTQINSLTQVDFTSALEDQTGAICGGSALFLVDANPAKYLNVYLQLLDSMANRKCGALLTTMTKSREKALEIERSWVERQAMVSATIAGLIANENKDLQQIIDSRVPCCIETTGTDQTEETLLFIEPIHPIPQLILVGAGHIGQALCRLGSLVDFEVTVIDNRPELTTSHRFPEASHLICGPLSQHLKNSILTSDAYIVIATQGHRTDIEALRCCIGSKAAYIGVIGSKRKTALMGQKFITEKWATPDEWNFVHTPVGIDIHARTVNEIAVSILAELIKERHEINFIRRKKRVSAIVLAAGKSTRMGQQKLLMPFGEKKMIETVVGEVAASDVSSIFVITGSDCDEIKEVLREYDLNFVYNRRYEEGMHSSVQAGVTAIDPETDGFLVLLGDQPMVSTAIVNRLISVFQKTGKGLLIPAFQGKRGHPVLIDSKYKNEISAINPEVGLRELFLNHPDDILEIGIESAGILKDIDTPEDYRREAN